MIAGMQVVMQKIENEAYPAIEKGVRVFLQSIV
jgi:hypothetical protein